AMCSGDIPAMGARTAAISSGVRRARSLYVKIPASQRRCSNTRPIPSIFRKSSPDRPARLDLGSPRCVIWCSCSDSTPANRRSQVDLGKGVGGPSGGGGLGAPRLCLLVLLL